ncbi:hypothetical protein [Enterovibrio norvegicus]
MTTKHVGNLHLMRFGELMDHAVTTKARDVDQHTIVVKLATPSCDDA